MRDGPPVCLIVDFQMPEMSGLELRRHLTSNGIKIPTILITAHGDAAPIGLGEDGLVANLRKPVQAEALFSAIGKAIGAPQNAS